MYRPVYSAHTRTSSNVVSSTLKSFLNSFLMAIEEFSISSSQIISEAVLKQRFNFSLLMSIPINKIFRTCSDFCGQWTVDSLPTNLIVSKVHILIQVFESTKPDGQKITTGLTHLHELYTIRLHCPLLSYNY